MTTRPQLLVVDDDDTIVDLLCDYLARFGLVAHRAGNGAQMWAQLEALPIDLVLLDLMLPGTDGLTLARQLHASSTMPFIILTARGDAADRVVGLELGADDYISKPFEPRELVARVQAVLRRSATERPAAAPASTARMAAKSESVAFEGWQLHREARLLTSPSGRQMPLSSAEYQLLTSFLRRPRQLVSRSELQSDASGRELKLASRSVDLLVSRLRQKLSTGPDTPSLIRTVRGVGYLFDAQPQEVPGG